MVLLSAAFFTVTVAACVGSGEASGGGDGGGEGDSEGRVTVVERTVIVREYDNADDTADAPSGSRGNNEQASSNGESNNSGGGARDGMYAVGEGGEVEFERTDNGLRLVEARANPGWSTEINDRGPGEIEVGFRRGSVEWHFEAELDDGVLRVEPADGDTDDRDD